MTIAVDGPTTRELTPVIVSSIVRLVRKKNFPGGVIAVRGRPVWAGSDLMTVDGDEVRVVTASSALAAWDALDQHCDTTWLVIITDRTSEDFGSSLRAHLVGERVHSPDLWQVVQDSFGARQIDVSLLRAPKEIAEVLLAEMPAGGWDPVPAGLLTRDLAFEALTTRLLGISPDRLDATGLLEWTLDPTRRSALHRLPDAVRAQVREWIEGRAGATAQCTLEVVRAGNAADALALALLAGLLTDPAQSRVSAAEARGQLGHRYGGSVPPSAVSRLWEGAARGLVEARTPADPVISHQLDRAQSILQEIGKADLAGSSALLPGGVTHRLRRFGEALEAALTDGSQLDRAESAYAELARHLLAERSPGQRERALMALRALRWFTQPDQGRLSTVLAAADRHVRETSWVDRARTDVWVGDDPALTAPYNKLYRRVTERRAELDLQFALLLAEYTRSDPSPGRLLLMEDVLRTVVLPLAKQVPVLLLVVDGMSSAVADELAEGIVLEGWREVLAAGSTWRRPVLSALPSVTSVCRTTLLSGRLTKGGQADEVAALQKVAAAAQLRARLFHKGDLERSVAGETTPAAVREAIQDQSLHLVAAVLNSVDDALDRSDPIRTRWTVNEVTHLGPLLRAAREVGRMVILAADHGHVLERREGELRTYPPSQASRWRPSDPARPAGHGERRFSGRRVVPDGDVILPVTETLRYGPLQAGYHGGATPAEMVTTLLAFGTTIPHGWQPAPPQEPGWWLGVQPPALDVEVGERPQRGEEMEQPYLFGEFSDLVDRLVRTDMYRAQVKRAGRSAPGAEQVVRALQLLTAHGRLPEDRLARELGMPGFRLKGFVAGLRRLLNVDGYEVLGYDADQSTVVLNLTLLREQFTLGK